MIRIFTDTVYFTLPKQQEKEFALYISWIVLLLSFVITALLYYAYIQRTRSNKVLEHLEQTRSNFFTNITHEFRTPLTVIQGLNRQMQEKENLSQKEKRAFRAAIERQSDKLLKLVNQMLEIAKLKSGVDVPEWKRGDMLPYLRMATETFRLYAAEKNVSLSFHANISSLNMDFIPSYIDKIVNNLLSNAVKHTEDGDKINFIVVQEAHTDNVIIRVSDTGEGIAPEDLKHIFELFYQSPHAKNAKGSGIGLAFVGMMIEKMNGTIKVESKLGKGSVFTVNLPLKNKLLPYITPLEELKVVAGAPYTKEQTMPLHKTETPEDETSISSLLPVVLLVEDNKDISIYVKSLLSDRYNIITARNGEQGLQMAEQHIPDVVITDVMMPVKDGHQLCKEMKQSILLNHIPVIMLTAKSSDEDRIEGLRCGVEAYIRKPFYPEELLIRIEKILENRRLLKEKYLNAMVSNVSGNQLGNDENMKFLQTISDIIHAEMDNHKMNSAFLADKMAMSVSQLSRKLNGIVGCSTISYVLRLKLDKARKMLKNNDVTINEVSDICGFYDANYFSRVFKKEFGISPTHYQKMPYDIIERGAGSGE